MENIKILIKNDFDEDLNRDWKILQKKSNCTIFQDYEWIKSWKIKILENKPHSKLSFVKVYLGINLVCILPLFETKKFNIKTLSIVGKPFNDYSDIILDSQCIANIKKINFIIIQNIINKMTPDLVYIENISENSNLYHLLNSNDLITQKYKSYQLIDILKKDKLPKKFVNDTLRQIKRLKSYGNISFKKARNYEEKKSFFEFMVLNKEKQLTETHNWNFFKNKDNYQFLKDIFLNNNKTDLSALYIGDKIVSVHIGYKYKNLFYYLFPSYDKNFAKYSPGNILLFYLITNFFQENGKIFDFTTGDENYKKKISNYSSSTYYFIKYFTLRGLILKSIIEFTNYIKSIKKFKNLLNKLFY